MIGLNIEIDVGGMIGTYHNCIADMEYSLKKKNKQKKTGFQYSKHLKDAKLLSLICEV